MLKDLGCANGWVAPTFYPQGFNGPSVKGEDNTPPEYVACQQAFKGGHANHPLEVVTIGRCYRRYTCSLCGITWTEDSSD
jgi:hypothetical protein